jgi:hypothetical protein
VLIDRAGEPIDLPYELNLWEPSDDPLRPSSIVAPVDSDNYPFDPLFLM